MRSTRAVAAVERLKVRSGNPDYALTALPGGLFYLVLKAGTAAPVRQSEALPLDAFVAFVDAFGPPKPRRISKLDEAFEMQLRKKR
jgi:hypothetical protein